MPYKWIRTLAALAIALLYAAPARADGILQPIDPAIQAAADGSNEFALDLYRQLRTSGGNLFFSPYSIDTAMAMVHAGAAGATADEMARALRLPPLAPPALDAAMAGLSRRVRGDALNNGYELHVASAMWGQIGKAYSLSYINRLRVGFGADLIGVDFGNPRGAAGTINQWVSNKTNGLIANLIDSTALKGAISLVLTNAIYFKGTWIAAFDPGQTHDAPWNEGYLPDAPPSLPRGATVPMMFQTAAFDFADGTDASALQMPYLGGDLSMVVLLPHAPSGLGDLEKKLTLAKLKDVISKLHREPEVDVSFPKFKFETAFSLREALVKLGMPTAFSNSADLSGIDGTQNLFLTDVVHQAYVSVDETGTEAAAATDVPIATFGGSAPPPRPAFRADHPFIFLIMDRSAGTILFMGRVVHPPD